MNDIIIVDQALTQVNTLHNEKKIDSARLMFSFHSRVHRKSAACTTPKVIKTWDKFAQTFTWYSLLASIPRFDLTRRVAIDYVHGTLLGVKIWKCLSINFVVWWATPWWTLVHWKVCKSSRKQICHHQASKLYVKAAKEPYWECGYLKASQLRSFLLLLITLLAWVIARNLGCLLFTWANWSVHGLDKRYAQFRTGKFHPRIAFTIATNQFHLPKNNREDLNPVSKMVFNKWNMDFCWEYTVRKKGLPFQMFHCSQKFPGGMIQNSCSIYFSTGF